MSDRMGDLAAEDSYDPFAAEQFANPAVNNVVSGLARDIPRAANWFYEQASKPDAEAQADTRNVMGGLASQLYTLPRRAIENSQFAVDTGNYDPAVPVEAALTVMGGGVGGTGAKAGETALTAGYDPKLWHGVSTIKLPKPIDEMSSVLRPVNPAPEVVASPARFQNSLLMPLLGDRTATAASLERVNGFQFENPVSLEGGHGYMANNPSMAWAAGKSIAPGIARVAREGAESGLPVHGVYTAMGERAPDFTHMMSDTLTEMAKHTKITPEGEQIFNETMRKVSPGFPGINDPNVAQYLRDAPGAVRNVFAKTMDTAPMQKHGFPSVAEARVAVTDPRLLNEPTGASGLSIARMHPEGKLGPSGHSTYSTGIAGDYVGGLPASVPKEVMFPDVLSSLSKHADAVAQARVDAGLKQFRPTEDYLMSRMPKGLPKFQEANQQWVDSVSKHLEDRGFTLGSGTTDQKGAAAIQGIRAYHSSPHDFDKFDLSKIGTGEGAQVYGHGLYFAENPAVSGQGGQYWNQFLPRIPGVERVAASTLQKSGFDRARAIEETQKYIDEIRGREGYEKIIRDSERQIELLRGTGPIGPRTYEVNINADPAHMLDWDKPISTQPHVEEALRRGGFVDAKWPYSGMQGAQSGTSLQPLTSGEDAYRALGIESKRGRNYSLYDQRKAATDVLGEAGIPGIKYLDQGSRTTDARRQVIEDTYNALKNTSQGAEWAKKLEAIRAEPPPSSNYVVFDPSIVNIMKKYGIAGAAPLGALAAQDAYQPQE